MTMSFETINCIAQFDSLGVQAYDYPTIEHFLDNHANDHDPDGMTEVILPYNDGGVAARSHLMVEGKILQGISLENAMVRFGDRGRVRACDCRVIHALFYGTPTLSWRHIIMMNTWITRESFHGRMVPYVCLISSMILKQNCLPPESLWVSKPVEEFNLATIKRNWKILVQLSESKYSVTEWVISMNSLTQTHSKGPRKMLRWVMRSMKRSLLVHGDQGKGTCGHTKN
ncbi:hypothetical protein Hdeb2414_s0005g00162741 [Helianthus debilis subsp. tardiflorus]